MPWYHGETLLELLESVTPSTDDLDGRVPFSGADGVSASNSGIA